MGALLSLAAAVPAVAGPDEPLVWPVVRHGWPDKLSAGIAVQPPLPGCWDLLIGSASVGQGGVKAGAGLGKFGGNEMTGVALQLTILRTTRNPLGAAAHQTVVGAEAQIMLGNISLKAGPALRVAGRTPAPDGLRLSFGIGYGF